MERRPEQSESNETKQADGGDDSVNSVVKSSIMVVLNTTWMSSWGSGVGGGV